MGIVTCKHYDVAQKTQPKVKCVAAIFISLITFRVKQTGVKRQALLTVRLKAVPNVCVASINDKNLRKYL